MTVSDYIFLCFKVRFGSIALILPCQRHFFRLAGNSGNAALRFDSPMSFAGRQSAAHRLDEQPLDANLPIDWIMRRDQPAGGEERP